LPSTPTPTPTLTATPTVSPTSASGFAGDCDGNGQISVAELILGVRIALGEAPLADCPSFDLNSDRSVSVAELVQAVDKALAG